MKYEVELTRSAIADLEDTIDWIARYDSSGKALDVLDKIETVIASLAQQPGRGSIPPELRSLGMDKYREIFFKPYLIIYHTRDARAIVNLIADGRRDMESLLQRRLTATP